MKIKDISAIILAGGKNTRIQQEKSLIKVNGNHLIDRQVELLGTIFENILIVTNKEALKSKFPNLKIVEDEFQNCGPLGGIHTAMKHSKTEAVFVFACDMPYLEASIILRQIAFYRSTSAGILVPQHNEGIEPLHAIYSKATLPFLEESLKAGRYSVRSFYYKANVKYLDFEQKQIKYFFNINTHTDLQKII